MQELYTVGGNSETMNTHNSKRKDTAVKFMSEMTVNLAKTSNSDSEYYRNLIDAMTMATHILKNTKEEAWETMASPRKRGQYGT